MPRRLSWMMAFAVVVGSSLPALATEQQDLVDKASITLRQIRQDPNFGPSVNNLLGRARAVLIFPNLLKGAFIVGAEGGRGVLLVHNANGTWSDPAFYFLSSASLGLQIGGKASSVLLIVNTPGGLNKIMRNSVKLGADVSVAVGPVGAGAQAAATTNVGADIYQYGYSEGAYGGINVEGSSISPDNEWNQAYYQNKTVQPAQIVIKPQFHNSGAATLRKELPTKG